MYPSQRIISTSVLFLLAALSTALPNPADSATPLPTPTKTQTPKTSPPVWSTATPTPPPPTVPATPSLPPTASPTLTPSISPTPTICPGAARVALSLNEQGRIWSSTAVQASPTGRNVTTVITAPSPAAPSGYSCGELGEPRCQTVDVICISDPEWARAYCSVSDCTVVFTREICTACGLADGEPASVWQLCPVPSPVSGQGLAARCLAQHEAAHAQQDMSERCPACLQESQAGQVSQECLDSYLAEYCSGPNPGMSSADCLVLEEVRYMGEQTLQISQCVCNLLSSPADTNQTAQCAACIEHNGPSFSDDWPEMIERYCGQSGRTV